jgi:hypothetical protein
MSEGRIVHETPAGGADIAVIGQAMAGHGHQQEVGHGATTVARAA